MVGNRRTDQEGGSAAGGSWHHRLPAPADSKLRLVDEALDRSGAMAVVLDGDGRIAACSAAWIDAAGERQVDERLVGVGADYLAACDAATGPDARVAADAAEGIRAVLRGDRREFALDYECAGLDDRRWFTLRAAQLVGPRSGALVTHVDISTVRAAELAVRGQLHRLWGVVDPASDFVFLLDRHGNVLGRTRDESRPDQWPVAGQAVFDFVHPHDQASLRELFASVASATGGGRLARFRARGPGDDGWRHFTVAAENMVDEPGVGGIVAAVDDVTRSIQQASSRALEETFTDDLSVIAVATDDARIITAINTGACAVLGVRAEQAIGRPLRDFVVPMSEEQATVLRETVVGGEEWSGDLDVRRRDGSIISMVMRVRALHDARTGFTGRAFLGTDQSRQRQLETSLQRHRFSDTLTGLPNRAMFRNQLRRICRSLASEQAAVVAGVDLDRFSDINTLHGTRVGSAVLREVGSALERIAGPRGAVSRLYSDVFAVASEPGSDPISFAQSLQQAIEVVRPNADLAIRVGASVGVRAVRRTDTDGDALVHDVLLAAEAAKGAGGGAIRQYDDALRQAIDERASLRRDLASALERNQLAVVFQPVVRLEDGVVVGAEALLRWHHPTGGTVGPDTFIPLAEQSPVIHDIGSFVLEEACRHVARWRDLRPEVPFDVAVNVSASQLADATLVERLRILLDRYALLPSSITLELTESMVMDGAVGREQMARLKATGVRIAIDDFGTGHSSLSRLKQLPLDVVKFDRSFVTGIGSSPTDATIVRTVASLAEVFGVDVVAEGVETEDDARALRSIGCRFGQGYLWSRPVPPEEIDHLLQQPFSAVPAAASSDGTHDQEGSATDALSTLRHELATPLAVLAMSVDVRQPDGTLAPDVVEVVARSVDRIHRLIDTLDLLDRIDHGTVRPQRGAVELGAIVTAATDQLRYTTGRRIDVEVRRAVPASVDPSLIEVVVTNLVGNAIKYSPDPAPVSVRVFADGATAHVEVHDRGPGIPAERLGTIWRKFGRLAHAVSGSGLGLYLSRGIARAHGGDLTYRPALHGGSVFVLTLPRGIGTTPVAAGRPTAPDRAATAPEAPPDAWP